MMSVESPLSSDVRVPQPVRFLFLSAAALAGLAIIAAYGPPRVKLIGLYPVAVGTAGGAIVAALAARSNVTRMRAVLASAVLVPLMLAGYAAESFIVWRRARADEVGSNLLAQPGGRDLFDRIRSDAPPANDVEAELFEAYRRRMNSPPSLYLAERLEGIQVTMPTPLAAAIAGAEFLAAWIAGAAATVYLARLQAPFGPPQEATE